MINVQGSASTGSGYLHYDGATILSGTGELVLSDAENTGISMRSGGLSNDQLINSAGHTIRGQGYISGDVVNQGVIRSEGSGLVVTSNIDGQGTLEVSGTSTLSFNGTQLTQGEINVANGATFDFNGNRMEVLNYTGDLVHDQGVYAPGASPAVSTLNGDYTMLGSSIFEVEIGGTNSGEFDQLFVTGDITLDSGELLVSIIDDFTLSQGQTFEFMIADGSVTGTFLNYLEGSLIGNYGVDLFITYQAGDGNDIALYTSPVPLPAASWLLLSGVIGLFGFSRKSQKRSS
jgi:hypothetical protein